MKTKPSRTEKSMLTPQKRRLAKEDEHRELGGEFELNSLGYYVRKATGQPITPAMVKAILEDDLADATPR